MKLIKLFGLLCLICFTFIYTEKVIDVSTNQDEIMIKLKEIKNQYEITPTNAIIKDDTIIPGNTGKAINVEDSYKKMKQIGYFEESLITYETIYPDISIYNNYNKYIISGNKKNKQVALIYIINNKNTIPNILNILKKHNSTISFFIDSSYINNNLNIIYQLNKYEIYNYGNNGNYTKDNLIIANNIINNKSNNNSTYCLFLNKNKDSLNNCANNKMLSIIPTTSGNYNHIKNTLDSGSIILISNTQELSNIINYIKNKGYNIVPLSNIITE